MAALVCSSGPPHRCLAEALREHRSPSLSTAYSLPPSPCLSLASFWPARVLPLNKRAPPVWPAVSDKLPPLLHAFPSPRALSQSIMANQSILRITRVGNMLTFLKTPANLSVGASRYPKGLRSLYVSFTPQSQRCNADPSRHTPALAVACRDVDVRHVRALIIGPPDTPYEFGFFEFAVKFVKDYPTKAPTVQAITTNGGRTRFNPNIYAGGKVCLSILGWVHRLQGCCRYSLLTRSSVPGVESEARSGHLLRV